MLEGGAGGGGGGFLKCCSDGWLLMFSRCAPVKRVRQRDEEVGRWGGVMHTAGQACWNTECEG